MGTGHRAFADLLRLCDRPSRELDREFGAAQPGPTPEGRTVGVVIAWSGTRVSRSLAWLARAVIWKGKNVDRARGRLVNRISPFGLRAITAEVSNGNSLFDGQPCIVIDYSKAGDANYPINKLFSPEFEGVKTAWYNRDNGAFCFLVSRQVGDDAWMAEFNQINGANITFPGQTE